MRAELDALRSAGATHETEAAARAARAQSEVVALKKKRETAKNETIAMARALEGERAATARVHSTLHDTLTPRAISQAEVGGGC